MKKKSGFWIMVTQKLPTEVAPPAMSIHWAEPWSMEPDKKMEAAFKKQAISLRSCLESCELVDQELLAETSDYDLWDFLDNDEVFKYVEEEEEDLTFRIPTGGYREGIERSFDFERQHEAVKIRFGGEDIRVFPDEFSVVSVENMKEYTGCFSFHENNLWDSLASIPKDPDERFIFEAALLDGCDPFQANNVLTGSNAEAIDDFPPPLGWYECPREYGLIFRTEEDLTPRYKEQ